MKLKTILLLILSTIVFTCCSTNKKPSLGSTVYIDTKGCLHVDKNCQSLKDNYAALYIEVKDLKDNRLKCTACISDNDSRKIDSIISYNRLKGAYKIMKDNGYDVPGDFKTFLKLIKDDKYAYWVYDACIHINMDSIIGNFDDFKNSLNFIK